MCKENALMIETLPSGTILHGHYRIERVLGSGGFGHVYLAIDMTTSQQYALKEYLVTGTSGQEQLRHESSVLAQLHHPNLPAFHDSFSERGRFYVVLNYIEGHDLTDLIRLARQHNDAIPIARIMTWLLSISDAVIFLHSQRPPIIHRDIKPDNIRITSDGTAILVDLGNAKAAADGARTLFFIRHQGTPGYAPLEQYPGGSGTDARSDVYALGGTLYFALTAHEPPSVSTRQAVQHGQPDLPSLQQQLANNPPEDSGGANALRQFRLGVTKPGKPAPRHSRHLAQLGSLPPELLNQLNMVIQKAMAMKPKDRYQSVAEFAHDLKMVLDAFPSSPPLSTTARPLNPNSTQPDLPQLYETLQATKDSTNPASTSPTTLPSSVSSASSPTCPRCNTPLTPQAMYCPRCGTPLTSFSQQQVPASSFHGNISSAAGHGSTDITKDQTLIIPPNAQAISAPARTSVKADRPVVSAPTSIRDNGSSSLHSPAPGTIHAPPAPLTQARPPQHMAQPDTFNARGTTSAHLSEFKFNIKLLIFMAVVVVVLLVIMVLLLLMQSSHAHVHIIGSYAWLTDQAQGLAYQQHLSPAN
jgi:serine/threonine protein kinase